jgi:hypothetical protein
MANQIQTVNEADKRRANFVIFHPEVREIKTVQQLKDQELIFIDGCEPFEFMTPFNLKTTTIILASLSQDYYDKNKWFKIISSNTVIIDQVRRWLKFDPALKKNQFPVKGVLRFKTSTRQKVPLWILENS